MAKKKNKSAVGGEASDYSSQGQSPLTSTTVAASSSKKKDSKTSQLSTSALIICRNKHWRYISSFHGPWLQLPPEVLESLANNNYNSPRPRPIDPAVFYDLLKIRKLVDEATNLAVRAASGVTSSVSNNLNASNSLLGSSGAALGLGIGNGAGNAKLSRERKHRMREQATQRLSKAYHLDEIACSVATMQSASTLEEVAHLVLQRSPSDSDAKYVHFFHEKIPSRQLAECTSLQPLDEVIMDRPDEAEILRTRAVTKIFKDDYVGAAEDLTLSLRVCRYVQAKHRAGRQQLLLAKEAAQSEAQRNGRWREELKLDEEDQPSSLETQLLFHRAGVYLTIACQHVNDALPPKIPRSNGTKNKENIPPPSPSDETTKLPEVDPAEKERESKRSDARKVVKTNAKRALRDYVMYLSHFDYTPGLPSDITEDFVKKVNQAANGFKPSKPQDSTRVMDLDSNDSLSNGQLSDALVPHNDTSNRYRSSKESRTAEVPRLPPPVVHQMSTLFSATSPADLPSYPETSTTIALRQKASTTQSEAAKAILAQTDCHEALTYHPLLTDALHSLLLCHCLVQTSTRELQRHAHMVARLARVCDGYPIFQAARSPSRADWIEVLRRSDNFIQLSSSWESLCAPAPLPGQTLPAQQKESPTEKKERLRQQAIMEALEDDRVHDEASFHAAVAARQRRQEEETRKAEGREMPKRWAQDDGKEYPISTERAAAVVRWIKEAPVGSDSSAVKKKKKGGKVAVNGKVKSVGEGMQEMGIADDVEKIEEEIE